MRIETGPRVCAEEEATGFTRRVGRVRIETEVHVRGSSRSWGSPGDSEGRGLKQFPPAAPMGFTRRIGRVRIETTSRLRSCMKFTRIDGGVGIETRMSMMVC